MTTKEKLELLNSYLITQGKKPLKGWSKSVAKLDERLDKEHDAASNFVAEQKEDQPYGGDQTAHEVDVQEAQKNPAPKKKGKLTIAKVCRQGFTDEKSNDEIHQMLLKAAEDGELKYDDSKKWYITWYRSAERRRAAKLGRGINEEGDNE